MVCHHHLGDQFRAENLKAALATGALFMLSVCQEFYDSMNQW